jgi:hypothetical protein
METLLQLIYISIYEGKIPNSQILGNNNIKYIQINSCASYINTDASNKIFCSAL